MKTISIWAKNHPWPARFIIAISHVMLIAMAYSTGILTASFEIYISPSIMIFFCIVFCITCIIYPIKGVTKGFFRHSYVRQKAADFIIVLTTFLMFTSAFNELCFSPEAIYWKAKPRVVRIVNKTSEVRENAFPTMKEVKQAMKKFKKQVRMDMKTAKKRLQQDQGSKGQKIVLTLLAVVGAFILFVLLGSLSCTLSCNGHEGLAFAVFFVGLIALISLSVIAIKAIWKKKKLGRA
jgi:hypothetical protein